MLDADKNKKKSQSAKKEEEILEFWAEHNLFEKSLEKPAPRGTFVFYEGPPTANGRPGIHHMLARSFKDAIPRYKTMRGYRVRRKGGWDTHGLPVEIEVEKKLGLTSKKQIEEYGVEKFNQKCKESVWEYKEEWGNFTKRMGYWVDLEDPYITYQPTYMESLWHVVARINDQGLLYKDYKVLPWCPRCGTALSSHELAQGYQDVKDLSVTAKFHLKPGQKYGEDKETKDTAYLLAWTTTPWTLPGNVGLAVGENISYTAFRVKGVQELYVIASDLLQSVAGDQEIEVVHDDIVGTDLVGLEYEPLYPYLADAQPDNIENAYQVYPADFVTTEDGTGIVHTAVMYGQDDFELGTEVGLPKHHLVSENGTFLSGTDFLEGRFVKDEEVAVAIIKDLAHRGLLFSKEKYEHSYPHCWRCKTPVIYYARDSWYVRMSSLRDKLIKENKKINWEPSHIREGRFGEWLRDVKDWAFSRERYWGLPLPVWESNDGERLVIGSVDELKKYAKKSGNNYFVMRHGQADHNMNDIMESSTKSTSALTEKGVADTKHTARELGAIDVIISSPLLRTKQTAEIIAEAKGLNKEDIIYDKRIIDINVGEFEGKSGTSWREFMGDKISRFTKRPKNGESYEDMRVRVSDFIFEIDKKYKGKNILIVAHGGIGYILQVLVTGYDASNMSAKQQAKHPKTGEFKEIDFWQFPHNQEYELDLHKPFIDNVVLERDGKKFRRVPEVTDVWFDSGSMPFAQDHFPFENTKRTLFGKKKPVYYPADYIAEGIDQTRGWFYTLHAVGNLMGLGRAYKNVISHGLVLDGEGKKMSKSVGNIVNPWEAMDQFGADTIRFWMYSVNSPGEAKSFDERTIQEVARKVFSMLENVVKFYELYQTKDYKLQTTNKHVLDTWILARLDQVIKTVTTALDAYKFVEATRPLREFIGDLSQWYLRRSRDRFKEGGDDQAQALATTKQVLETLALLLAPFAPFTAEDVYRRAGGEKESVHLASWPKASRGNKKVVQEMKSVRDAVSAGLLSRDQAGIKVRQPLAKLTLPIDHYKVLLQREDLQELIRDEVNVKRVVVGQTLELDTELTPELEMEGKLRELIRQTQELRKKEGLNPDDAINLTLPQSEKEVYESNPDEFKQVTGSKKVTFGDSFKMMKV